MVALPCPVFVRDKGTVFTVPTGTLPKLKLELLGARTAGVTGPELFAFIPPHAISSIVISTITTVVLKRDARSFLQRKLLEPIFFRIPLWGRSDLRFSSLILPSAVTTHNVTEGAVRQYNQVSCSGMRGTVRDTGTRARWLPNMKALLAWI